MPAAGGNEGTQVQWRCLFSPLFICSGPEPYPNRSPTSTGQPAGKSFAVLPSPKDAGAIYLELFGGHHLQGPPVVPFYPFLGRVPLRK